MKKLVYIITQDPKERCELVSSVFAQALTALSFDYECSIFVLDNGVRVLQPEYIAGLEAKTFEPLSRLVLLYKEMGGKLYGCNPAMTSRDINAGTWLSEMDGPVNASTMIEKALEADAVFTY